MKRAIFFDRDGTLNVEKDYVHRSDQWVWLPGAREALALAQRANFLIFVVTNQSGVGRGYFTEDDVRRLHDWVADEVRGAGMRFDGFYYCPHAPDHDCDCRKPKPGMLFQAQKDFSLDLAQSFFIGDKAVDVEAALAAGVHPYLVETGYGQKERNNVSGHVPVVPDVLAAVRRILSAGENQ